MRVLLLADSCNPEWPSLPSVGFKTCRAIADHVDVVLATQIRNKPAITKTGCGGAEVVYIDNEYIGAPLYRLSTWVRGGTSVGWTTGMAMAYPAYLAFEWEVWKCFKSDLVTGSFDIVHRVTPMSPTLPSPLAKWSPVPFVLGPVNGGLKWPREFRRELRREKEWLSYLRRFYKVLPYHNATYKYSAAILSAFKHTSGDLPKGIGSREIGFPEVGIDPELFRIRRDSGSKKSVTFIYVGRFVPYKCPDVVLKAFSAGEGLRKHKLIMVGDGPERTRLENIVRSSSLGDCVEFTGWKTQAEVGVLMRNADIFVFPSIRELGAGVVVEAMACGLVPVVVDYGAPGELVGACGVKIPLGTKASLVSRYAEELSGLIDDPERRFRMGAAAHKRAISQFAWDAKARKIIEVYRWLLGEGCNKPEFEDAKESLPPVKDWTGGRP